MKNLKELIENIENYTDNENYQVIKDCINKVELKILLN